MEGEDKELVDNDSLLSILEGDSASGDDVSKVFEADVVGDSNSSSNNQDDIISNNKLEELKSLAKDLTFESGNSGTGNLDTDLNNWFDGVDNLPSDPLKAYVGNPEAKLDYGLCRNTLSNYGMMGKLREFLYGSCDTLFTSDSLNTLPPEELLERVKVGFTMYEKLFNMNQKTLMSIKDYKLKAKGVGVGDDMEELRMLLSSIPSDKLKEVLSILNKQ